MYFSRQIVAAAALAFFSTTNAQISEQCVSSDVCYRLNIPASTAQAGNGDIFFSIRGPTSLSWIGLGQGSNGMTNANTFIIYADGTGNVTLSPRHARGNAMPLHDPTIDAELLAGSGVHNGTMTAYVRCGNCQSWGTGGSMDFKASSGGWIHARATGDALNSTNVEERIRMHSIFGAFTWNFTPAIGGASTNPFQDATLSSNAAPQAPKHRKPIVLWCHGVFAATAFAIFFPLGALLIRVGNFPGIMWVHAGIQMFAWTLFATAFGLGLYFGITYDILAKTAHPIIGMTVFGIMTIQPLSGWIHHKRYVKTGARSASSYAHIWIGRGAVILGMINGGLGLMWARHFQRTYIIVYSVIAGVMGVAYLAAIGYGEAMRKKRRTEPNANVEVPQVEKSTKARTSWGSKHSGGSVMAKSRNDSV